MAIDSSRPVIVDLAFGVCLVLAMFRISTSKEPPANFVFGDSLVDVGNNNYIASLSKANYVPFGIDFGRPTGRFTNGRTIVDIIGKINYTILFFSFSLMCYLDFSLSN